VNVYGRITILDPNTREKNKVLCRCICGQEKWINIFNIRNGDVLSCGCLRREKMSLEAKTRFTGIVPKSFVDYVGRKIGLVTVLERIRKQDPETWYSIKCECGTVFECRISTLRRSKYRKCKCGYEKHPLKHKLQNIKDRCFNPKNKSYKWYGLKSISVCDEWIKFPIKFVEWAIKNGWEENLTIDRKDSTLDYSPSNCIWVSKRINSQNAMGKRWEQNNTG